MDKSIAVIGGGNGAMAFAGYLGLEGFKVFLASKFPEELSEIKSCGGIKVDGVVEGFAEVEVVDDLSRLEDIEFILVVVPANAHEDIARFLSPYLRDGHVIVLNPGRTLGALAFTKALKDSGCDADVTVVEAQTLLFACRTTGPAEVLIKGVKQRVSAAAFPAERTDVAVEGIRKILPQFEQVPTILHTSFMNIGAIFHPTTMILNCGRVESKEEFDFYQEGMTPRVVDTLEGLDKERVDIARAYGVDAISASSWLEAAYGVEEDSLYENLMSNKAYKGIKAPNRMDTRYILEDVPTGLVPFASLGKLAGVRALMSESIINLAGNMFGIDFWEKGRTMKNLGLDGISKDELPDYVYYGKEL